MHKELCRRGTQGSEHRNTTNFFTNTAILQYQVETLCYTETITLFVKFRANIAIQSGNFDLDNIIKISTRNIH